MRKLSYNSYEDEARIHDVVVFNFCRMSETLTRVRFALVLTSLVTFVGLTMYYYSALRVTTFNYLEPVCFDQAFSPSLRRDPAVRNDSD